MLQATLNRTMVDEGRARYWNDVTQKRDSGDESSTKYGQRLLAGSILPFAEAIRTWLTDTEKKRSSHRGSAFAPLKLVDPTVTAFIAARSLLDSIGLAKSYGAATGAVGALIEDEVRFAWLRKHHPGLFRKLERQLERCMNYEHRRTVIVHTMNKHKVGEGSADEFRAWDEATHVKMGMLLVDLFQSSTQLVETVCIRSGRKTQRLLQATAKTTEWIRNFHEYHELLDPVWLPTVEVPQPWADPFRGGYTCEDLPNQTLVKRVSGPYAAILEKAQMPDVYEAVNALQSTPWKINHRVHGILQHFWNIGRAVGGLPPSDDEVLPNKPDDIATNKEALKAWKQRAARVHVSNAALRSTRLQARKLLNLAQKFSNVPKFYYPYQLDFRGRVYTVPTFLTPQGSDLARSLLLFAEGVPVWDDTDAYWLAVYGANLFGKDKITFEERVKWVADNRATIEAVGKDPLACQWWQEADEPWQFLAWCIEWSGWLTTGAGFVTHLPVCLDGTNNGLQILSMLTRDEIAAKATNVLPSDSPADIYGDVAKRATALMEAEVDSTDKVHADYWRRFGIDRKTTKRPVMVLPYGGTFHSCREYVSDWYKDTCKARGEELPEFKVMAARVHYLAQHIWDAIEFCVGRPRMAMTWLQECAQVFSEFNLPILWTSPSGFPVQQAYKEFKRSLVQTSLGDKIRTIDLCSEHPTKLSKRAQKNGISPNFVHSCDAAALVKTVSLCRKYGIGHFAMIHDSYGTHAPRVHEMASALRTAFVSIFTEDRLEMLRTEFLAQLAASGHPEAELPPVPPFGSLSVSSLYESEFFFA
jgi:DNA-directed RNA polymerase